MGNKYSDNTIVTLFIHYDELYVPINVKRSSLIFDIHKKIQNKIGIDTSKQPDLYIDGDRILYAHRTIEECKLQNGDILEMK